MRKELSIRTGQRNQFLNITSEVRRVTAKSGIGDGICTVYVPHTTAGVTINEAADPTVRTDFEAHFNEMVPENQPYYCHTMEGADDMPAHLKSSILGSNVQIPITKGSLNLGTWQGIYLCEHRNQARSRTLVLTARGE